MTELARAGCSRPMIWAQARDRVIGADGGLPWHLPEDLALFKRLTAARPWSWAGAPGSRCPSGSARCPAARNVVLTRTRLVGGRRAAGRLGRRGARRARRRLGDRRWGGLRGVPAARRPGRRHRGRRRACAGDTWAPALGAGLAAGAGAPPGERLVPGSSPPGCAVPGRREFARGSGGRVRPAALRWPVDSAHDHRPRPALRARAHGMVTPLAEDGSIDLAGAQELAAHLVDRQAHDGLVVCGTTASRRPRATPRRTRAGAVIDAVGDRVDRVAGVGTNNTAHTIEQARAAERPARTACWSSPRTTTSPRRPACYALHHGRRRDRPAGDALRHPAPLGGADRGRDAGPRSPSTRNRRGQGRQG